MIAFGVPVDGPRPALNVSLGSSRVDRHASIKVAKADTRGTPTAVRMDAQPFCATGTNRLTTTHHRMEQQMEQQPRTEPKRWQDDIQAPTAPLIRKSKLD